MKNTGQSCAKLTRIIAICTLATLITAAASLATVKINGTAEQRQQLARWLTYSLRGTDWDFEVTVDAEGNLQVPATGGNAAAQRLRDMINDNSTNVEIDLVDGDDSVFFGAWVGDANGKSTGHQKIDVGDLRAIGNVLNSYGFTPDHIIMHEIAEVFYAVENDANYLPSHNNAGIPAEEEVMEENGTSVVGGRFFWAGDGRYYIKIRRRNPNTPTPNPDDPNRDPNHVIVRLDSRADSNGLVKWYRETIDCNTMSGLVAIADPDPFTYILDYNFDGEHPLKTALEAQQPQAVAFDAAGNLYVADYTVAPAASVKVYNYLDLVLNTSSAPVCEFTHPDLVNPTGMDIDLITGEIFVSCENAVLRFTPAGELLGLYTLEMPCFNPTGVAVYRNDPLPYESQLYDFAIYEIYVTNDDSDCTGMGSVLIFDVECDMNQSTSTYSFGSDTLINPQDLDIDQQGNVWVVGNGTVHLFDECSRLQLFNGNPYFVSDPTRTLTDVIAIDGQGVYVLDGTTGSGALLQYDFNANLVASHATSALQCPVSAAIHHNVDTANLVDLEKTTDFNSDQITNLNDFAALAQYWNQPYDLLDNPPEEQILADTAPAPFGDGMVDCSDLANLADNWLD